MKLIEKCATAEYRTLMKLKPADVNTDIIKEDLKRRGYSNMFEHFSGIIEGELYTAVNTKESICWILEYLTFLIKVKAYNISELFVEPEKV